jgi:hypothetical protein
LSVQYYWGLSTSHIDTQHVVDSANAADLAASDFALRVDVASDYGGATAGLTSVWMAIERFCEWAISTPAQIAGRTGNGYFSSPRTAETSGQRRSNVSLDAADQGGELSLRVNFNNVRDTMTLVEGMQTLVNYLRERINHGHAGYGNKP